MKKILLVSLPLFVLAAAVACLGFVSLRYHDAYARAEAQVQRLQFVLKGSTLTYGLLRSYDPGSRTLEVEWRNRYRADGAPDIVRLSLRPDAFIGFQELTSDGARTYLSTTTPAAHERLASLAPGTRLKFLTVIDQSNVSVEYLLFGDPL